jgi:hypothetical protein
MHIGRSWWPGKWIENACPCPKAPCGLVIGGQALEECLDHWWGATKSMREIHTDENCPGLE